MYTDGLTEAVNSGLEQFGVQGILEALRRRENGKPEEILEAMNGAVKTFIGNEPQFDDLTMLCVEYKGV